MLGSADQRSLMGTVFCPHKPCMGIADCIAYNARILVFCESTYGLFTLFFALLAIQVTAFLGLIRSWIEIA